MLESKQISYHSLLNWPQGQLYRDVRDGKVKLMIIWFTRTAACVQSGKYTCIAGIHILLPVKTHYTLRCRKQNIKLNTTPTQHGYPLIQCIYNASSYKAQKYVRLYFKKEKNSSSPKKYTSILLYMWDCYQWVYIYIYIYRHACSA